MTQQSGNQFDDDLTVGLDDEGSFSTDSVDLFEFTGDEESPIARLKTIILSIDWEINDDILQQLDDELVDLGDIWAGDKVKQIYIQGLNKIGRYIYKEKANAHPNAINLLITFYHNLEKIVAAGDSMDEDEKKELLLQDVKKFDQLKAHISKSENAPASPASGPVAALSDSDDPVEELKSLKALVLGIDWEISQEGLQKLSDEVRRLEGVFSQNKAKLILLQGIGALSAYINKMRSQSNGKVFPLLHSFYEVLEKISAEDLPADEEKQLLFAEVEKFNAFKGEIAQAQSQPAAPAPSQEALTDDAAVEPVAAASVVEEVSEVFPVDEVEEEHKVAADVDSRLSSVFGDEELEIDEVADKDAALAGVDVETEADDDSDEEALPYEGGTVAPALAEADEESSFSVEKLAEELAESEATEESDAVSTEDAPLPPGVDVETEADDDSDEEALPFEDGEIAPALSGSDDLTGFDEKHVTAALDEEDTGDLDSRLDSFFDDEVQSSAEEWGGEDEPEVPSEPAEKPDDSEDLDEVIEAIAADRADEPEEEREDEPSLLDEGLPGAEDDALEESIEDKLSIFNDDVPPPEPAESEQEAILEAEDDLPATETEEDDPTAGHLAFLDDDVPSPLEDESAEAFVSDDDSEDESEGEREEIIAALDDSVSDTDLHAALEEDTDSAFAGDEQAMAEETEEEKEQEEPVVFEEATEEPAEEAAEDPAEAFTDEPAEEFDEAPAAETIEEPEEEPADEQDVSSSDDSEDEPAAALEDDFSDEDSDAESYEEDTAEEPDSDTLSFLDEDDVPAEKDLQFQDEEQDETQSDDIFEEDEIEFTVPGEITQEIVADFVDEPDTAMDDVIEFQVPGDEVDEQPAGSDTADDSLEGVIFEVVEDDVEVDPLPGEEYVDDDELAGEAFSVLRSCVDALHDGVGHESLQAVLAESSRLRSAEHTDHTGKIFLQLLDTVCQQTAGRPAGSDDTSLPLIDALLSGLMMNSSDDVSSEKVQEHLLECTSRVLLLQQVNSHGVQNESPAAKETPKMSTGDEVADSGSPAEEVSLDDERLKAFVQEELAEIKNIFLEEIKSLRKEIAEK